MGIEEYIVRVETPGFKYKSHKMTLLGAIKYVAESLKATHSLSCLNYYERVETYCIFTCEQFHYKTYCFVSHFPYTKYTIKKTSKGDIDHSEFEQTLNYVKGLYNERI